MNAGTRSDHDLFAPSMPGGRKRAVALADLARSLRETGRRDQAQGFCDEARAIAERLSANALRNAIEQVAMTA